MFDHLLRGLKDRLMAPLATLLRGVQPNVLTLVAFVLGIASAFAAWRAAWLVGLALWLFNRIADGLDGAVARLSNRQSDFGGYLDILLDFIVYAAIPVAFAIQSAERSVLIWTAVLEGTFFVNACSWMYLSAVLEKRASGAGVTGELTTVTMPPAIIAGLETLVFYTLFFLLPLQLTALFRAMSLLVGINVIQRLLWARRTLSV